MFAINLHQDSISEPYAFVFSRTPTLSINVSKVRIVILKYIK